MDDTTWTWWHAVAIGVALATAAPGAPPLSAQEPVDSTRVQLERLRARIDSLEALVRSLQEEGREEEAQDALSALREAAAAAAERSPTEPPPREVDPTFVGRQRSLQALNPEISVNVDVFGHVNTDDVDEENFVPREFEFSFQSSLDPFSRAKIFVTHHAQGPEVVPFEEEEGHAAHEESEGGFEIEEGYVEWVGLPAGLTLKLGKFFQRFGALNRWHAHALPMQSRSLPHVAFVGEESLAQAGASVSWLLPVHGLGAYDASLELTRSSNALLFGESTRPSVLGHLNGFWQLGRDTDLDLGVSWINGSYEDETAFFDRNLYAIEGALTWRPPERAATRTVVLRGGVMVLDGLVAHEDGAEATEPGEGSALGFWSTAEVKVGQQWWLGARFDRVENPEDPDQTAWMASPTLTWWQSEFVRLRLEYDLLSRSTLDNDEGRLWLQVTFAMGPHKHESY